MSVLFTQRVAQLLLGRVHFARWSLAQQNSAQFFSLIVSGYEFFLCPCPVKLDTAGLDAEVADKIHPQIEHLAPEVGKLFVTNSFFSSHVCSCDQALLARVVPMRLPPHPTHQTIRIKCQIA